MFEGNSSLVTNVCAVGCGVILGYVICSLKSKSSARSKDMDNGRSDEEVFSEFDVGDTKLVLVVQNGLKMGKGKIAAQAASKNADKGTKCSHASVMAYRAASSRKASVLKKWLQSGQRKVVVKVEDEKSMLNLASQAKQVGLLVNVVCDAGRTQIPSGSKTVLAVGPGDENLIDSVTGHLKLM